MAPLSEEEARRMKVQVRVDARVPVARGARAPPGVSAPLPPPPPVSSASPPLPSPPPAPSPFPAADL